MQHEWRIFQLEIYGRQQGDDSISVYFFKIIEKDMGWVDRIDSGNYLPSPGSFVHCLEFLMGLNESYGVARNQILLMDPLP